MPSERRFTPSARQTARPMSWRTFALKAITERVVSCLLFNKERPRRLLYLYLDTHSCAVQQPAEFFARLFQRLFARRVRRREAVAPVIRLAGVDDRDRVREVACRALLRRQRGIGGRIP